MTLDDLDNDDPLASTHDTAPLNPSSNFLPGEDRLSHSTLDESVWTTLQRDILAVWRKMLAVLYPKFTFKKWPDATDVLEAGGSLGSARTKVIGEWDLWGPLLFCLALSTLLSMCAKSEQKTEVFAGVFAMVWVGEAVVTMQIKLLGGNM